MRLMILVLLIGLQANALPRNDFQMDPVIQALRSPHEEAVRQVKVIGKSGHKTLEGLAFNEKLPMKTRWQAFLVYSDVLGAKSQPVVERGLKSETWFLRSAGLVALQRQRSKQAKPWAIRLLKKDPALLVRMKAVEVLSGIQDDQVVDVFWQKLKSADSFHNRKSLWIRQDIARSLIKKPRSKDTRRWARLLYDQDRSLNIMAKQALNQLAGNDQSPKSLSHWRQKHPRQSLSL